MYQQKSSPNPIIGIDASREARDGAWTFNW